MATKIEWTEETWNPVTGCSKVSEGCRNCYAERLDKRFNKNHKAWTSVNASENFKLHPDRLMQPLHWRKHRQIFVNSMSDLFHDQVPDSFLDEVFGVMLACQVLENIRDHTFQILTKRPERMKEYLTSCTYTELLKRWAKCMDDYITLDDADVYFSEYVYSLCSSHEGHWDMPEKLFPLKNVWIGVSVENQDAAIERIPTLLTTPAAVKFLSCEPLLGPIHFHDIPSPIDGQPFEPLQPPVSDWSGVNWVIAGGESGPNARPMHPDWVRILRDQCVEAEVPFFFKQWGEWAPIHELRSNEPGIKNKLWFNFDPDTSVCRVGKANSGRILDGRTWGEMPQTGSVAT